MKQKYRLMLLFLSIAVIAAVFWLIFVVTGSAVKSADMLENVVGPTNGELSFQCTVKQKERGAE